MAHKKQPPPRRQLGGGEIFGSAKQHCTDNPPQAVGQLIDKYGHVHSEAVFRNWSPAAIMALGIRRVGGADG